MRSRPPRGALDLFIKVISVRPSLGTNLSETPFQNMKRDTRGPKKKPPRPKKKQRPAPDKMDEALHDVVEAERDRGEINTGAEPDQKSEVQKPRETD